MASEDLREITVVETTGEDWVKDLKYEIRIKTNDNPKRPAFCAVGSEVDSGDAVLADGETPKEAVMNVMDEFENPTNFPH